jgi:putative DNA primase/helicase
MRSVLDAYPVVADSFSVIREEHNGQYLVCDCPLRCHSSARLRLWLGADGRLLFGCYACEKSNVAKLEILRAVGLSWKDCFPAKTDWKKVRREIVAAYPYRDERGVMLYETVRLEPGHGGKDKTFFQRRPKVPGSRPRGRDGWVNSLDDVRRVLYRLPELVASDARRPVFVAAGEKDADGLADLGFTSTTNVCGEHAEWLESYSEALAGRHVVVMEDADATGRRHANEVVGSLTDHAASVRRLRLPARDATALLTELRKRGVWTRAELRAAILAYLTESRTWIGVG